MSYEEEFDNIMRNKAEEMEYPFEEESWRKAGELISRNRGGGSGVVRSLLWSAAVITAGGISTLLWFAPGEKATAGETIPQYASSENVNRQEITPATAVTVEERNMQQKNSGKSSVNGKTVLHAAIINFTEAEKSSSGKEIVPAEPSVVHKPVKRHQDAGSAHGVPASPVVDHTFGQQEANVSVTGQAEANADARTESMQPKVSLLAYSDDEKNIPVPGIVAIKGDDDYVSKRRFRKTFFAEAEAGAAFWTGWQYDGAHNGRGINWFGGAGVGIKFCKNWDLTSGLQVFNFAHLEAPFYTATAKAYGFSSVSSNTIITTEELRYVGLPVRVGYNVGGGGHIRGGLIAAQLWYASNRYKTNTVRNGEITETGSGSNNSLYDGMNQQVLMITAGYGVRLSERLFAGVDVVYGLTDLFSERTYLRRSEKPLMVRAGITFRFLDK